MTQLHRDNHYVPCLYLKRFVASPGHVFTYRLLVPHSRAPVWKSRPLRGVAYHAHLYTRPICGADSDELERWLEAEFETPAEEALNKATSGARLSRRDWHNMIRFVAAQDVRTPARLIETLARSAESMPTLIKNTLQESVRKFESARSRGETLQRPKFPNSEYIPIRVTREIEPAQQVGVLKAEVVVGRGLWFFNIRHLLTKTLDVLGAQKWSILVAPKGLTWFTSDDPVIRLNYYANGSYDFNGGWGNPGTEILLPLDSRHLLYTKVGHPRPPRHSLVKWNEAELIRRFIAEHAHRFIFASYPDDSVPQLRPRTIDAELVRNEREQWNRWHEEQNVAEKELMGDSHISSPSLG